MSNGRMFEYVKDHPQSTTGEMAKGLNANRGTIAAEVSHMVRAGEITRGLGAAIAQALSDQATSNGAHLRPTGRADHYRRAG